MANLRKVNKDSLSNGGVKKPGGAKRVTVTGTPPFNRIPVFDPPVWKIVFSGNWLSAAHEPVFNATL